MQKHIVALAAMRIALGLICLWSFFDKLFGLGFSTAPEKSWLAGISQTTGFLTYAAKGPFTGIFHALAGIAIVDWLFMLGLLGIGVALTFGLALRLACASGSILFALMYLAVLPPQHHPFLDEHIVYVLALQTIVSAPENANKWGFGTWWNTTTLVKKYHWLRS